MSHYRGRWLGILLLLLLSGCGEPPVAYFHPHSALAPRAPQSAQTAVLVYGGDVGYILPLGAVMLGSVRVDAPDDTQYEDRARTAAEVAARAGGTHMLLQQTEIYDGSSGANVSFGPGMWAPGAPPASAYRYEVFSVYRVPPEHWGQLPPPLRPQGSAAAK